MGTYTRRQTARDRVYEGADIMDSRDVIEALQELQEERDDIEERAGERWDEHEEFRHLCSRCFEPLIEHADTATDHAFEGPATRDEYVAHALSEEFDEDDAKFLKTLEAFEEECESVAGDWVHGATLIADHYFETYAQEFAEDIGALSGDAQWPANHIDWKAAAEELQQDYSSVTFGETEYWVRS